MKTKYSLYLIAFIAIFLLNSCENSTVVSDAKLVTIDGLKKEPGFSWFDGKVIIYNFDTTIVQSIKTNFKPGSDKFFLFVKPSCGCIGTTERFPNFYRIMKEAGIADSNLVIYAMSGVKDNCPLLSTKNYSIILSELPSFYRVKNGVPIYSIMDTFNIKLSNGLKPTMESVINEALAK